MNNALFVEQLTGLLQQLEQRYAEEAAPLEQELARIKAKYQGDIESTMRTLELARQLAPDTESAGSLPPDDYPMKVSTGHKALWVVRKLGGEARPIEVYMYIHPFDPDISKGAIGTAMVRLGRKGDLIKKGDDPQEPYHIPVQPKDEESEVRPLGLTGPVDNGKEENEEPILTGSAVVPQTTTIPELVLRVAKKKGKSRKKDLIAGVLEENPTLGSNSIGVAISRMAKRGDLVRTQRGRFPLFGPPKEPETTPTEPELQFDETGTPMKSRPPEPEWAEQLRRQHDNAL